MDLQSIVVALSSADEEAVESIVAQTLELQPGLAPVFYETARQRLHAAIHTGRQNGFVKTFNPEKGYGFIGCAEAMNVFGSDVFVHKSDLGVFQEGQDVSFTVQLNKNGRPQAHDIGPPTRRVRRGHVVPPPSRPFTGGSAAGGAMPISWQPTEATATQPAVSFPAVAAGAKRKFTDGPEGPFAGAGVVVPPQQAAGFQQLQTEQALAQQQAEQAILMQQQVGQAVLGQQQVEQALLMQQQAEQVALLQQQAGQGAILPPGGGIPVPVATFVPMPDANDGGAAGLTKGQYVGRIKSFNASKGYGFIECPELKLQGYNDVFLHHKQIGTCQVGNDITFDCFMNQKGQPQATNVAVSARSKQARR